MHFIAALREVTNPICGNGGTGVCDEENFHDLGRRTVADFRSGDSSRLRFKRLKSLLRFN